MRYHPYHGVKGWRTKVGYRLVSQSAPRCHQEEGARSSGHPTRLRAGRMRETGSRVPRALGTGRVPHRPGTGTNRQRPSSGGVPSSAPGFTSRFGPWLLIASDRNRRKRRFPNSPALELFARVLSAPADQPGSQAHCKPLPHFSPAEMGSPVFVLAAPMQQPRLPKPLLPLATSQATSSASPFPIPSSCTPLCHPFLCLYTQPGLL